MDLDYDVAARSTGEQGSRFVDEDGGTVAAFPVVESDSAGATAEREIPLGQLAELLYGRTSGNADYRFGARIATVRDDEDGVTVTFADGTQERFDVLVIAEGVNSRTRADVFGPVGTRELGVTVAYYSIDRQPDDDDWWRWYQAPDGRTISLRPDNVGRIRALLSFLTPPGDREATPDEFRRRFADAGWRHRPGPGGTRDPSGRPGNLA
jgi:2-polyprenyl-6-methoxyphenol hydroxylase-like FAD-dependent oxidoreductase